VNTVNLTAETMVKMGKSLDSIQYPEEHGGVSCPFSSTISTGDEP
jgi:hypothetical protein